MCLLILNGSSCQFHYKDNKSDRVVTFIVNFSGALAPLKKGHLHTDILVILVPLKS